MVSYSATTVQLEDLLLDPNNFRFRQPGQTTDVSEARISEEKVQANALERIKADGVAELKRSISENGFVPVERIVVRALPLIVEGDRQKYVAVEGNRRTAALKLLEQDNAGGVDLSESLIRDFSAVPVLLATDATNDDLLAIMGIRHVGGPKGWGGYQSALLVYQLLEGANLTAREVASRLSLTVNEVNRRHRAFSALTQMINDEEFGESVNPEMYPIFHEAVGQPTVREWLGWSQPDRVFSNVGNRELFYTWLVGVDTDPKIRSYIEVRELRQILENTDALIALKDDDQTFSDALAIVRADAKSMRWLPNAKSALASLNEMGPDTIESLDGDAVDVLTDLRKRAGWIVKAHKLSSDSDAADDEN